MEIYLRADYIMAVIGRTRLTIGNRLMRKKVPMEVKMRKKWPT